MCPGTCGLRKSFWSELSFHRVGSVENSGHQAWSHLAQPWLGFLDCKRWLPLIHRQPNPSFHWWFVRNKWSLLYPMFHSHILFCLCPLNEQEFIFFLSLLFPLYRYTVTAFLHVVLWELNPPLCGVTLKQHMPVLPASELFSEYRFSQNFKPCQENK